MKLFHFFLFLLFTRALFGQIPIVFSDPEAIVNVGSAVMILEDKTNRLTLQDVLCSDLFKPSTQQVPNLGIGNSSFWIKFVLKNNTDKHLFLLELAYPLMDEVEFYSDIKKEYFKVKTTGDKQNFNLRKYKHQNFLFDLELQPGESQIYFLKVR